MARAALTVTTLTANTVVADVAGDSLDATNHHVLTPTKPLDQYVFRFTNTTASQKTITIKAGDYPPALNAGQGDLVATLAAGNVTPVVKYIGALESARFLQANGTVEIDIASAATGSIATFLVPRG